MLDFHVFHQTSLSNLLLSLVHDYLLHLNSVMFKRLAPSRKKNEEETRRHINEYADSGLRTLVLAYRVLDEREYREFNERFDAAKADVSVYRDEKIEKAADSIERDLLLLGATAVEDKLQKGVCVFPSEVFLFNILFVCIILTLALTSVNACAPMFRCLNA
jgi:hypothetical protein